MSRGIGILSFLMFSGFGTMAQVPTISGFSPSSGPVGTVVTITGSNFDALSSNNIVRFGPVSANITSASTTQLVVTAPIGTTFVPISVTNVVTGLTGSSAKPFIANFPGGATFSTTSLAAKLDVALFPEPTRTGLGDFDNDGKTDFALSLATVNVLKIFPNTSSPGTLSFGSAVDVVTNSPNHVCVSDLDRDGKLDIVVLNMTGSITVLRNSLGLITFPSFSGVVTFATGSSPTAMGILDLDLDGKPEIIVTNFSSNTISVFRNTSTQGNISGSSFTRVDFAAGAGPNGIAFGDVDQDGLKDVLISNSTDNSMSVFKNISTPGTINSGSLATRFDFATGVNPEAIAVGDLDLDGKEDVVLQNATSNSVSVFKNTHASGVIAAASFAPRFDLATGIFQSSIMLTDVDGDGKLDIIADNTSTNVSVFRNISSVGVLNAGSFATKIDFLVGTDPYGIEVGDFDGDGKPDLISANYGGSTVSILRNTVLAPEPSAQPPGPITFFNVISTAFRASWAETNPTPDGYLAVMSANLAPTFVPVDGIPYGLVSVGSVGPNTMWVVQNSSEPGIDLTNLATGIDIYVKVYAFNGAGPTINYLVTSPLAGSQKPTADLDKPTEDSNATPATVAPGASLLFKGNFSDATSGVDFVEVEYRSITGEAPNDFQLLEMLPTTGSTYEVALPAIEVGELGIEYRFLATDFEGNTNLVDQQTYRTRVRYENGLYIPYTSEGRTVQNYRIIAVPLILDDKSLNTVLGSTLGTYDPTIWAAYRWNGSRVDELNNDSQIIIGQGYWFITTTNVGDGMLSGAGTTPDVSPSAPFQIDLAPGWNQIGNPYNFHISWADILAANPTHLAALGGASSKIRVFRGAADNVDELLKFEGGFVKNTSGSNITIDIPVEKNLSINSRKATIGPMHNPLDQPSWDVLFNLSQGETTYNLGGVGMRPDADVDYDTYDDFNLPRFFDYLEVKFPKERVGMSYTKDIVPTAGNFIWEFSVESNIGGSPISMSWDNSYFGTEKEIYLVDLAEHRAVNMNEVSKYAFSPSPSRPFKVVYGDKEFVKNEILPGQAVLFAPYPNPFSERVTIGYSLPKEAVTQGAVVDIYSGQGNRVSTVNLPAQPGEGSWEWVSHQAPGMYFVRLRIGDQTVVKKIIKQ